MGPTAVYMLVYRRIGIRYYYNSCTISAVSVMLVRSCKQTIIPYHSVKPLLIDDNIIHRVALCHCSMEAIASQLQWLVTSIGICSGVVLFINYVLTHNTCRNTCNTEVRNVNKHIESLAITKLIRKWKILNCFMVLYLPGFLLSLKKKVY